MSWTLWRRRSRRPVRVFSVPGKNSSTQFVPLFCKGLEGAGVEVLDLSDFRVWSFGFDFIHLHFPVHYIAERGMGYSLIRSLLSLTFYGLAKCVGNVIIVYTVHDIMPFRPRAKWLLEPLLAIIHRLVGGYVFLSDTSYQAFVDQFPTEAAKPRIRIDHSAFPVAVTAPSVRQACRATLIGPNDQSILVGFLGEIKDYKGLEFLPLLPRQLADGTPVKLVIAGRVDPTFKATADPILDDLSSASIRVDKRLSDVELEELLQAVDVVILPYTRGWNSGMAMLALSSHSRVLTTRRPLFRELERAVGAPWFYTFDEEPVRCRASLASALTAIRNDPVTGQDEARLRRFLADRTFERAGEALARFYRDRLGWDAEGDEGRLAIEAGELDPRSRRLRPRHPSRVPR